MGIRESYDKMRHTNDECMHKETNRFSSAFSRFQSFAALCIAALSTSGRPSPVMFDYPSSPFVSHPFATTVVLGRGVPMFAHTRSATRVLVSSLLPFRRTYPPTLLPLSFLRHLNPSVYRVKHLS